MSVCWPDGWRVERLSSTHPRKPFRSGHQQVDDWLHRNALQNQDKRLSVTKALIDNAGQIAGFYTLAMGQVDFGDLPTEIARKLPRRQLPVVVLAWLGIAASRQKQGFGQRVLAQALVDCHEAGVVVPFIAVIVDCVDDSAKSFYQKFDFKELPGHPYRLYLPFAQLGKIVKQH